METDQQVRIKAFDWLSEQVAILGDVLPRKLLEKGYIYQNEQFPLVSPQGIFKPKTLELPLSITTAPKGPYDDSFGEDGFLLYRYRGTDPNHRDNIGLRKAFENGTPLVYFHGIVPGKYLAVWPVYIIADTPSNLTFKVAVDDSIGFSGDNFESIKVDSTPKRAYLTASVKMRLHQRQFREMVLDAYRSQCAFCRLKHIELLDAAHIIPDIETDSQSTVDNGISLCKLHHAAFDSFILGISPDYIIHVRKDVLDEEDGPMLKHGLKALHSKKMILPSSNFLWPNQEYLERRYFKFNDAA